MSAPDTPTIAARFGRAGQYDAHGAIQRAVARDLARRIAALPLRPSARVLEVGCGTGFLGEALMPLMPGADWTFTDLSPAMLERARARLGAAAGHYAVMDGERPHLTGPFDLVASSLAVQWFGDLAGGLARLRDLLAPGGWLAVSTLVLGSFDAWRDAHGDLPCGMPDYPAPGDLADLGFAVAVVDVPFAGGGHAFLRHLKGIGAAAPRPGHRPLSPAQLRQVIARFDASGGVATYRIAYCTQAR